ncbi:MAG: hypothetical protein ACE363_02375 [Alphaproteobacteria bacterium]
MASEEPDYIAKRDFFFALCEISDQPLNIEASGKIRKTLDSLSDRSPKLASKSLDLGINDLLEEFLHRPHAQIATADAQLSDRGLMTITAALSHYSKQIKKILKRGKIRGETEYYLLKGVRDGTEYLSAEHEKLADQLLEDFEIRTVGGE